MINESVKEKLLCAMVKNVPVNVGETRDAGSIPGPGRAPAGGHGKPLQYSCLKNSMDRGLRQATVGGLQRLGHD